MLSESHVTTTALDSVMLAHLFVNAVLPTCFHSLSQLFWCHFFLIINHFSSKMLQITLSATGQAAKSASEQETFMGRTLTVLLIRSYSV